MKYSTIPALKKSARVFLALLIFLATATLANAFSLTMANSRYLLMKPFTDTVVGSKLTDSTGQITITPAQIQESILPTISELNGSTVIYDSPFLTVSPTKSYLVFRVTNIAGQLSNVAIELVLNNTTFSYHPNSGGEIHICKAFEACTHWGFKKLGNRVVTCYCVGL